MIINRGYEAIQEIGTKKVGLEGLIKTADEMETKWKDDFVSGYQAFPLMLTKDGDIQYLRNGSETVKADLTGKTRFLRYASEQVSHLSIYANA